MSRLLIKGAEAALPTGSGSASTFDNATVVRLVNTATGADHLVTVVETQGGTTVAPENVFAAPAFVPSASSAPFTRVL